MKDSAFSPDAPCSMNLTMLRSLAGLLASIFALPLLSLNSLGQLLPGTDLLPLSSESEQVLTVPWSSIVPQFDRSFGRQPLAFERNEGQTHPEAKFLAHGPGYTLFLTDTEAVMALSPRGCTTVRMRLVGRNPSTSIHGENELRGKINYFIGNDSSLWHTNISTFARVRYEEVYPGIDLVYYGNEGQLEYDFIVAPGADPNRITLEIEGAEHVEVNADGDLLLSSGGRQLCWSRPVVYQQIEGAKQEIPGRYNLIGLGADSVHRVQFVLGPYDSSSELVIDPALVWGTFLGGSSGNGGYIGQLALDHNSNVYITGMTDALDFPTKNPFQASIIGKVDAFVTKLDSTGQIVYSTYLGPITEYFLGQIAVDSAGSAYVVGATTSRQFPIVNAVQATFKGGSLWGDAFITKLSANGSALIYSTYLGGSGDDFAAAIAVDNNDNVYVTGETSSRAFPTANAFQPQYGGGSYDAFLAKLNPPGSKLIYSTYLGGSGDEVGQGRVGGDIAVDDMGSACVVGGTSSVNFPTQSPFQQTLNGKRNGFFTKFSPDGSGLLFSSYLGGTDRDGISAIALGKDGDLYLTGSTFSPDFPTASAFQPSLLGSDSAFVARYRPGSHQLIFSTFLGGSWNDAPCSDLAVDATGRAYVVGTARSPDFPLTADAFQTAANASSLKNGCLSVISADGSKLEYSSFLGSSGSSDNQVRSLGLDADGNLYLSGSTSDVPLDFPISDPIISKNPLGNYSVFVTKFRLSDSLPSLKIFRTGQTVVITWPASTGAAVLEATPVLPAITWASVQHTVVQIADENVVTFDADSKARLFRLRRP